MTRALEVLAVFSRLGVTSFGGPVAHLGYFRAEFVERRKWVDEETFADLVALCQFLPGPASSQVAISLGIERAGLPGAIAAWVGFTLPSAALMIAFALGLGALGVSSDAAWIHGLKVVAVVVVALAVWAMAQSLCPDRPRATLALAAAAGALALDALPASIRGFAQLGLLVAAGILGAAFLTAGELEPRKPLKAPISRLASGGAWALFFGLLVALPLIEPLAPGGGLAVFSRFYRVGSVVFGGGHVVLPLLQREVVDPGWVAREEFLAGYGAAQAVPGPLFSFAAYLGAVLKTGPGGFAGGMIALVGIYLPSFFLVVGALPFWDRIRSSRRAQAALRGTNAAVVGLLLAALYKPVWTDTMKAPADFGLALGAFALLGVWKWPPWIVVVLSAGGAALLHVAGAS